MKVVPPVVLDACCAISLYASGSLQTILDAYPERIGIVDTVRKSEVKFIKQHRPGTREQIMVPVDLQPLYHNGALINIPYIEDEDAEFAVNFAALGAHNGECFSIATTYRLGWGISTDDGLTRDIIQKYLPDIPILTTSFIVKNWSDVNQVSSDDIRLVIRNMRSWGGYKLTQNDPLIRWIEQYI